MPHKIIIVENDLDRRARISGAFEKRPGVFELDFVSLAEARRTRYEYHDYRLAMIDFGHDPGEAMVVARVMKTAMPGIGVIVLAPHAETPAPVEIIDMGIGPAVIMDGEGAEALPGIADELVDKAGRESREKVTTEDLQRRNRELRDITDALARQSVNLLRLRNELAAEKSKLETLIEGIGDGIVFFDADGRLEMINKVAAEVLSPVTEVDGLEYEKFAGMLKASGAPGGSAYETFEASFADRIYLVRVAKARNASGAVAGSVALLLDVTKEKEFERLKDEFSSMVSHELRTPLTSISSAVENLLEGYLGELNGEQKKFLEIISRNVARQRQMIDDLLDLDKMEAGKMPFRPETTDLEALVRMAVEQYSLAFKDKGVEVEARTGGPVWTLADPDLVGQVLANLLSNAIKFTEKGDRVIVSLDRARGGDGEWAVITVADTGIGIEPDKIAGIFDKYTQVDSSTRRRYPGTGLGLAICREIARLHGGSITVESEPGKGSVFTFSVPVTGGK